MTAPKSFRDQLLEQGATLTPEEFSAYRQKLDQGLSNAVKQESRSRRALLVTFAFAVGLYLLAVLLQSSGPGQLSEPLAKLFVLGILLTPVAAFAFAILYFFKYRPAARRLRAELDESVITGMAVEIKALKKRLAEMEEMR